MNFRTIGTNIALFTVSVVVSLLLCELALRALVDPSDYLSVEMVHDDALGAVASGGGFDRWGFRNRSVPDRSDIVVIGDSHTYGNTATMEDSWPYVLGRLSGRPVYNMGMGGYGPNQYFHLFTTRALALQPRTILVGLYMGDDFENAFLVTYGLEHWARLRELPAEKVDFDIWGEKASPPSWHKQIRVWLSRHSVTYQMVFHGPLLGRFQGELQIRNIRPGSESAVRLAIPANNILEAFLPTRLLRNLDQDSQAIREGMRITYKLLAEMSEISRQKNIQFLVVVIPTKEMVFADYLEHNSSLPVSTVIDQLLANERLAREKTFKFLTESNIDYVDTLPALVRARERELYARTAADMHPNRNGYRVIAEAVFDRLKQFK
jgi:hypothetical protein